MELLQQPEDIVPRDAYPRQPSTSLAKFDQDRAWFERCPEIIRAVPMSGSSARTTPSTMTVSSARTTASARTTSSARRTSRIRPVTVLPVTVATHLDCPAPDDDTKETEQHGLPFQTYSDRVQTMQLREPGVREITGATMRTVLASIPLPGDILRSGALQEWTRRLDGREAAHELPAPLVALERFLLGKLYLCRHEAGHGLPESVRSACRDGPQYVELEVRLGYAQPTFPASTSRPWEGMYECSAPGLMAARKALGQLMHVAASRDVCRSGGVVVYTQAIQTWTAATIRHRRGTSHYPDNGPDVPEREEAIVEDIIKHPIIRPLALPLSVPWRAAARWLPILPSTTMLPVDARKHTLDIRNGSLAIRAAAALELHVSHPAHRPVVHGQGTRTADRLVIQIPFTQHGTDDTIDVHVTTIPVTGRIAFEVDWTTHLQATSEVVDVRMARELMWTVYWLQLWMRLF